MRINSIIGGLLISVFVCSCVKTDDITERQQDTNRGTRVLTGLPPQGGQSRTQLDVLTPMWCPGDRIWISNADTAITVTLEPDNILSDGSFRIIVDDMPGTLYAAYPSDYVKQLKGNAVIFDRPYTTDGSFGSAHLAVAYADKDSKILSFRNAGAVLRLLIDEDIKSQVSSIDLIAPGICGEFACDLSAQALDPVTQESHSAGSVDKITVRTGGKGECFVGLAPMTLPVGTEFILRGPKGEKFLDRISRSENVLERNTITRVSFMKSTVKLVQKSFLDPAWHPGDQIALTDGPNVEIITVKSQDIAQDGTVTVSTSLLTKDLRGVCPAQAYSPDMIKVPKSQDGTISGADVSCARIDDGILVFDNYAQVLKLSGLPGAAESVIISDGYSKISMKLSHRSDSDYYVAVLPGSKMASVTYYDHAGNKIGDLNLNLSGPQTQILEYGPLRDISEVDLGDGYCNWLEYFPDDAKLPDLIMVGTHDAGTYGYSGVLSGQVKCQDIDFASQLSNGVRCFDIRLSENMNIFHGAFYCNVGLGAFFDAALVFLKKYPRETVICLAKDENAEGEPTDWTKNFNSIIDSYGRDHFLIDKELGSRELGDMRGKVVIVTRNSTPGTFGYLDGAPSISFPGDSWSLYCGGDIAVAIEDSYTVDKGDGKKKEITDFLSAISAQGGFLSEGHRNRWIITYTSGYNGYTLGIPMPEKYCNDLLSANMIECLESDYDSLSRDGITFFHDFVEKWSAYTDHLLEFVKKK